MFVIKRSGQKVPMRYDSITDRNIELSKDLDIDVAYLSKMVIQSLKNGMTTTEIDELAAETAAYMSSYEPDYDVLAARITVSNHQKSTSSSFFETMKQIYEHINKDTGRKSNVINEHFMKFIETHKETIDNSIDYSKDFNYSYFGFKTLLRLYLIKVDKKIVERPQHMLMRVACAIHSNTNGGGDITRAIQCYKDMADGYYTHASPTLFNSGASRQQLSSCFLLDTDDDLKHIYETNLKCALISKHGGGIGVNITKVRAKGSTIHSTNGVSDGIVPMIQVFNSTARYCNQCMVPDTIIYTKNGQKQIKDVKPLDEVITVDGTFKPVVDIFINNVDKEILKIRSTYSFEEIRVTKEHQILSIQGQNKQTNFNVILNRLNKSIIKPEYVSAEELTTDSFIGFPLQKLPNQDDYMSYGDDFFRFYGIMLGDGHICSNRNEAGVTLNEKTKLNTMIFIKKYLNNLGIHYWETHGNNCISIRWTNTYSGVSYNDLYNENKEKRVHSNYMNLIKSHRINIIKGLLETDGSNLKEVYFTTTSYELAHNLRYLLLSLGILSSGHIDKVDLGKTREIRPDQFITNKKISYDLRISKHPLLNDIIDLQTPGLYTKYFVYDNIIWSRIKDIKTEHYTGQVYDLGILNNNNYLVGSFGLVHNSGKRKGSIAMYLEPWHPDVVEFLALRYNQPPEELRARDIFLALWVNDLFMKRVEEDGIWSLFCPSVVPQLAETYGDEFEHIYLQAEQDKKYMKQMKARELFEKITHAQIETGLPYILYKDSVNKKNMQENIGIIRSSNLCVSGDTKILTKQGHIEINKLVNKETEIWNGFEWSTVIPKQTGENQPLLEVELSNGIKIKCTEYHKFPIVNNPEDESYELIEAIKLDKGQCLLKYSFPEDTTNIKLTINSVKILHGLHDTFCFTENKRNLGMFNGVLLGNCAEILEVTNGSSTSVCNLASISLPKYIRYIDGKPIFDYEKLYQITKTIVRNIDNIIDINYYPIEEAKKNNTDYRPMGIGIQGLADVFAMFKAPWGCVDADTLNRNIFEIIYYAAVEASHELALERGSYSAFEGSPYSKGILQYHLWNETPTTFNWNWKALEEKVKRGMRNSLLIALMPTASSSQILGNNECFEAFTSNLYSRSTLAGDFIILNKHLARDLKQLNLWNKDIVNKIIENDGSVQGIEEIPDDLKEVYKTVWEIKQSVIVKYAAMRAPFVDQTQSMNIFFEHPTNRLLSSLHMMGWKAGLKTGNYYIRSKPSRNAVKFTILKEKEKKGKEYVKDGKKMICTEDICVACSS